MGGKVWGTLLVGMFYRLIVYILGILGRNTQTYTQSFVLSRDTNNFDISSPVRPL